MTWHDWWQLAWGIPLVIVCAGLVGIAFVGPLYLIQSHW